MYGIQEAGRVQYVECVHGEYHHGAVEYIYDVTVKVRREVSRNGIWTY